MLQIHHKITPLKDDLLGESISVNKVNLFLKALVEDIQQDPKIGDSMKEDLIKKIDLQKGLILQ